MPVLEEIGKKWSHNRLTRQLEVNRVQRMRERIPSGVGLGSCSLRANGRKRGLGGRGEENRGSTRKATGEKQETGSL